MKHMGLFVALCFFYIGLLSAQNSKLVYLGENGKLKYTPYANTGETDNIHRVPDFSYAGYAMGGVALPEVQVALTLSPIKGDNRLHIQEAIDQVSKLPINTQGFRGVILLSSGVYPCSGPLYITASGIILKGEAQDVPEKGGTQLIATAKTQHDFIQLSGQISHAEAGEMLLDTIFIPKRNSEGAEPIDGDFWTNADVRKALNTELDQAQALSIKLKTDINDYAAYHSKEGSNKPYLKISYIPVNSQIESTLTLYPTDDAYVQGGESAQQNYGTAKDLVVKYAGENNKVTRESFLKFEIPAVQGRLQKAELNLWCSNAGNANDMNHYVYALQNHNWSEQTITYASRPQTPNMPVRISSKKVGVGAYGFALENVEAFSVGQKIILKQTPNQAWIDALQMGQYGWTPSAYQIEFKRRITKIKGDSIFMNAPVVQCLDERYGGGEVFADKEQGFVAKCGIQDMLITSTFENDEDENHGWSAILLKNAMNCWVKNVTAQYFGYACVNLNNAYQCTVEDCAMLDPKSITTGSRKYSFNIGKGSFNLVQRCYTRGGRHDYVMGARVAGPNVFLDCLAQNTFNDIGPHHRYATGTLFDNISGGLIRVQNRKDMGTGHGWAGAQTMFWNLVATDAPIKVESPVGAMNWGIACKASDKDGAGYWEPRENPVWPRSLYLQQLHDRLGDDGLFNVSTEAQRKGSIYPQLELWAGLASQQADTQQAYAKLTVPGIIEAANFNKGLPDVAYHDLTPGNNGHAKRIGDVDVFTEPARVQGNVKQITCIGNISPGEWINYTLEAQKGSYALYVQYASIALAQIKISLNGEVVDTLSLAPTASLNDYKQVHAINLVFPANAKGILTLAFLSSQIKLHQLEFKFGTPVGHTISDSQLNLFPNPSSGWVYIKSQHAIQNVEAFSLTGEKIAFQKLQTNGLNTLQFKPQQVGSVFVKVQLNDGSTKVFNVLLR